MHYDQVTDPKKDGFYICIAPAEQGYAHLFLFAKGRIKVLLFLSCLKQSTKPSVMGAANSVARFCSEHCSFSHKKVSEVDGSEKKVAEPVAERESMKLSKVLNEKISPVDGSQENQNTQQDIRPKNVTKSIAPNTAELAVKTVVAQLPTGDHSLREKASTVLQGFAKIEKALDRYIFLMDLQVLTNFFAGRWQAPC
jgi:hypothetical protein